MRKHFLFISLVVLLLSSCQKSIVWDDLMLTPPVTPPIIGGGGTTGSLLVKLVTLSNLDTLTYGYSYDSSKRLIKITTVGLSNRKKVDDTEFLIRDVNGKLIQYTKISYSSTSTSALGYDTLYTKFHYPTNSSNFDYTVLKTQMSGFLLTDSTVFSYTNGKISQFKLYYSNSLTIGLSVLAISSDYTYDSNGNIATLKNYEYSSITPKLFSDLSYTYDSKKSPFIYGNEAIAINADASYIGPNNGLSAAYKDYSSTSSITATINYTYSYNANGYPAQANGTGSSSNSSFPTTLQVTYFYQ